LIAAWFMKHRREDVGKNSEIKREIMSKLNLRREHNLSQSESKELAEKLLAKLVDKFGGTISEQGNNFAYKHTMGVDAIVEPNEGEFVVDVKLGFMARSFAPKLEGKMNEILDQYLS